MSTYGFRRSRIALLAAIIYGLGVVAAACGSADSAAGEATVLFEVDMTVDFGADVGQGVGTLFELTDDAGDVVAGAGFLDAYNTYSRSDHRSLHFFVKPEAQTFSVDALPDVNDQTGRYLNDRNGELFASTPGQPNNQLYRFDPEARAWEATGGDSDLGTFVAGRRLVMETDRMTFGDDTILTFDRYRSPTGARPQYYYANGWLIIRLDDTESAPGSKRLVAYRWRPDGEEVSLDESSGIELKLTDPTGFVYAFGQYKNDILVSTNDGSVYVLRNTESEQPTWDVLVEHGAHSYQVYSMVNFRDELLLGHYPSGNLLAYDGDSVRTLSDSPPAPSNVSGDAREAQTLTIYGGDLYVGVWPWGELWRLDESTGWQLVQRMFTHPAPTAEVLHPYEAETAAADPLLEFSTADNDWGQRVTGLVPFDGSLHVSTSSKSGAVYDERLGFLSADDLWRDYGRIHRLTLPGQLSVPLEWPDGPVELRFVATANEMSIYRNDELIGRSTTEEGELTDRTPTQATWEGGVYGPLRGELLDQRAVLAPG